MGDGIISTDEKLDRILLDLSQIKKHWNIVEDREATITDFEASLANFEQFALDEKKLARGTINNQKSIIRAFLSHSGGHINHNSVKFYLSLNEDEDWKSNQLKALRRYIRDFLKLGNWITEFKFTKRKAKVKKEDIPTDEQLAYFCSILPYSVQMIFLILLTSGLRIGEVLKLSKSDINFETNMIDASNMHKGETKSSWISFITRQTAEFLLSYIETETTVENTKLFGISYNAVQEAFKKISYQTGIFIKPHLLRTIFSEKCSEAEIDGKYIDAFCGRIPKKVLDANYTVYSPKSLREQHDKVGDLLTLPFADDEEN